MTDATARRVVVVGGDCAAVPNLATGGLCAPTAQHAVRQAARLSHDLTGRLAPYRHRDAGAVASLGLHKGVAQLYGVPLRGWLAWLVHRLYHGSRLPCSKRRLLVNLVWALGARGRDPVAVTAIESPHAVLRDAIHARVVRRTDEFWSRVPSTQRDHVNRR